MIVISSGSPIPCSIAFSSPVPLDLSDFRISLIDQLTHSNYTNACSTLCDYLECLVSLSSKNTLDYILFQGHLPWNNLFHSKPRDWDGGWAIRHEILLSVAALTYSYHLAALNVMSAGCKKEEIDSHWKHAGMLVKTAKKYLRYVISHKICDPSPFIAETGLEYLNALSHLSDASLQMTVVSRNVWTTNKSISDNFSDLDLHKVKENYSIYVRVVIYIHQEICTITAMEKTGFGTGRCNEKWSECLSVWKSYCTIYLCYYLSLECYKTGKVGDAIGLVNYAIFLSKSKHILEDQRKRDKLKQRLDLKAKVNEKSTKLKLQKKFEQFLPPVLVQELTSILKISEMLKIKFTKDNDNISFQPVLSNEMVPSEYLFGSAKLPNGRGVPISDDATWVPECYGDESRDARSAYY